MMSSKRSQKSKRSEVMFSLPLYVLLCLGSLFSGYVSGYSLKDYALHFPNKDTSSYVNIWGMPSLTQSTVCFWMKSSATNDGTPFSYNVEGNDNQLLIYDYGNFLFDIGDTDREVQGSANDGQWHHICFTWQSSDGALRFYKDGRLHMNSTGLKTGYTIKGGGSLVLGQDQDAVAGGFDASQSFQGSLKNVNVWSYVLSANAIKNLSKSCLSGVGNMYKWTDFIHGVKGKTRVVIPSPCYPLSFRG